MSGIISKLNQLKDDYLIEVSECETSCLFNDYSIDLEVRVCGHQKESNLIRFMVYYNTHDLMTVEDSQAFIWNRILEEMVESFKVNKVYPPQSQFVLDYENEKFWEWFNKI